MTIDPVLHPHQPIGIFDSGIGGLSVARAIRQLLPGERLHYFADTGHAPYGEKSDEYIYQRMQVITQQLLSAGVKAIVVACNTATTAAIARLRAECSVPIIGVEPGVKPATLVSKSGVVGVLATPRTLQTPAFSQLSARFAGNTRILLQPCPGLVPLIEALALESPELRQLLQSYIQPLLAQGADTLVLGCTHYNLIVDLIADTAGPAITIVRTEMAVAKQLQRRLSALGLLNTGDVRGPDSFYSSGDNVLFQRQLQQFWCL
ncbi:glutamate racemase [Rheinheimera sp. FR7-31]|uniref:glutamate racemase n=1 Tax=Rheinheimera fenheensis TaxID=3152295 RepID=UPI00325D6C0A